MAPSWTTLAAVVLISTGLGGCGGSDDPDLPSVARAAATVAPPGRGSAPTDGTGVDGVSAGGVALTEKELCGLLSKENYKVLALEPPAHRYVRVGGSLLALYSDRGLPTDIDALAAQACPDAASELLTSLRAGSFEALLSHQWTTGSHSSCRLTSSPRGKPHQCLEPRAHAPRSAR